MKTAELQNAPRFYHPTMNSKDLMVHPGSQNLMWYLSIGAGVLVVLVWLVFLRSSYLRKHRKSDGMNKLLNVIQHVLNTMKNEDLENLLNDDKDWKAFVVKSNLSRHEADIVYEVLTEALEDKKAKEFRKKFLKAFPQMKLQLKEQITQLYALADKVDNLHKNCTFFNAFANTTSIMSGFMGIAGLILAPVTAGTSVSLTAIGAGLGAVSNVTTVSTSIVKQVNLSSIEAEVKTLLSNGDNVHGMFKEILQCAPKLVDIGDTINKAMQSFETNVRAMELIESNPRLASRAARFVSGRKISPRGTKQVKKALAGTPLAMTKKDLIKGTATASISLVNDVANLVQNLKDMHEGTTESAKNLRQRAQVLEEKLEVLTQFHKSLQ